MIRDLRTIRREGTPVRLKICLVGEFAVGKTSLLRRFVHGTYEDRYIATSGTPVTTKELEVEMGPTKGRVGVILDLWDIMGSKGLRDLSRDTYFDGVQGILAVCDTTRPETLPELNEWLTSIRKVAGTVPTCVLANKTDIREPRAISPEDLLAFSETWACPFIFTSAKTGEAVEDTFAGLTKMVLRFVVPDG